jgi:hypothetical protein
MESKPAGPVVQPVRGSSGRRRRRGNHGRNLRPVSLLTHYSSDHHSGRCLVSPSLKKAVPACDFQHVHEQGLSGPVRLYPEEGDGTRHIRSPCDVGLTAYRARNSGTVRFLHAVGNMPYSEQTLKDGISPSGRHCSPRMSATNRRNKRAECAAHPGASLLCVLVPHDIPFADGKAT